MVALERPVRAEGSVEVLFAAMAMHIHSNSLKVAVA